MATRHTKHSARAQRLSRSFVLTAILVWMITGCSPSTATVQSVEISGPKVDAPTPLNPGEETGISLNISAVAGVNLTYEWKVDLGGGEIMAGQGTPAITYCAPDKPGTYKISVIVTWDGTIKELAEFVQVGESPPPPAPSSTPRADLTDTPTSILTSSPTPSPTATQPPPPPTLNPPTLVAPGLGSTAARGLPKLQWKSSALPSGYSFVVHLRHDKSGQVINKELSTYSWVPPLPAEKHGWWTWRVQVVKRTAQGLTDVATSEEWGFWYDPWAGGSRPDPFKSTEPTPDGDGSGGDGNGSEGDGG
jgi:hypothetical protein